MFLSLCPSEVATPWDSLLILSVLHLSYPSWCKKEEKRKTDWKERCERGDWWWWRHLPPHHPCRAQTNPTGLQGAVYTCHEDKNCDSDWSISTHLLTHNCPITWRPLKPSLIKPLIHVNNLMVKCYKKKQKKNTNFTSQSKQEKESRKI